jgi:hypothetical protein
MRPEASGFELGAGNLSYAKIEFQPLVSAVGASFAYKNHNTSGTLNVLGMTLTSAGTEAYIDLSEGPVKLDIPTTDVYPYTSSFNVFGTGKAADGANASSTLSLTYLNERIFGVTANSNVGGPSLQGLMKPSVLGGTSPIVNSDGIDQKSQANLKSGDQVNWQSDDGDWAYYAFPKSYLNKSGQPGYYATKYEFYYGASPATGTFTLLETPPGGLTMTNSLGYEEEYMIFRSDQTGVGSPGGVGYTVTFDLNALGD